MILQEMIDLLDTNVDDVSTVTDAVRWLNAGKDKMAIAVGASFPNLTITSDMKDTFIFPEKYHHIPVLYASAMFKGQDTAIAEKNSFMQEFQQGLLDFQSKFSVPEYYRDDDCAEQFTATGGQATFTITKNTYDSLTGDLKVYVNDKLRRDVTKNTDPTLTDFTLSVGCVDGDRVTAVWEIHTDLIDAPYSWWTW